MIITMINFNMKCIHGCIDVSQILTANDSACLLLDLTESDLSRGSISIHDCIREAWIPCLLQPSSQPPPDLPSPDYVVIDLDGTKSSQCSLVEYYVESKDVLGISTAKSGDSKAIYPLQHLRPTSFHNESIGVIFNGELVDIDTFGSGVVTTSLWMKALPCDGKEEERKFLAVFESVECLRVKVVCDGSGNIVQHSEGVEELLEGHQHLVGCSLLQLVPSLLSYHASQVSQKYSKRQKSVELIVSWPIEGVRDRYRGRLFSYSQMNTWFRH